MFGVSDHDVSSIVEPQETLQSSVFGHEKSTLCVYICTNVWESALENIFSGSLIHNSENFEEP
jgi:hypothetical protein